MTNACPHAERDRPRSRPDQTPAQPGPGLGPAPIPGAPAEPTLITPAFLADPYPAYRALREAGPLHFSTEFFGGAWLLTRHEDVAWALKDARLSARRTGGWVNHSGELAARRLAPFQALFARALLFLDAPDHTRLRQLLMPAFRPAGLAALRGRMRAQVDALLDAVDPAQPFDLMARLACPLPARVMCALMGVDGTAQELARIAAWSDDIAAFLGHPQPGMVLGQRAQRSALAMAEMFKRVVEARRLRPAAAGEPDLIDLLLQAESQGRLHSLPELLAQCVMLLFAGFETTRHLLGNGVHAVLGQPGAWQRLGREEGLLPLAVRELLRYDSPVQYTGRRVASPFTLHGRRFRRGELLIPLIGAAHRDPRAYDQPDALRLDRREAPHLAFGMGPHVCIGAALTLMEAELAFAGMLARWPGLRLAGSETAPAPPPERLANPLYRGLKSLWLVQGPGAEAVRPPAPACVQARPAAEFHPGCAGGAYQP